MASIYFIFSKDPPAVISEQANQLVAIFQVMLGEHIIPISLAVTLRSRGFQTSEGRYVWQSGGTERDKIPQGLSEVLA